MHEMLPRLQEIPFPKIRRSTLETLQVNLGYLCNQSCLHCHVNAGPGRKEVMTRETVDTLLEVLAKLSVKTLDLTGGAPEMNPSFRYLVAAARADGVQVIDRCNLTILGEPGYEGTAEFLAEQEVEVVASLPCYLEDNVDAQRGQGVFDASIRGLQQLNALGYAQPDSGLQLNLVYNPQGPVLPPPQQQLRDAYQSHLDEHFGIRFNDLYTITNMPIQRFGSTLVSHGQFDNYMAVLQQAHQTANLPAVMCRSLVSVDWEGYVYDCDFNQMLNMPLAAAEQQRPHLRDLSRLTLAGQPIAVAGHCFGCTAGQGSSCGGAL